MARLPSLTAREMIRLLEHAGFRKVRQSGSHALLRHPATGRRAIVPIHSRDLPRGTVASILKEAGITRSE